jgi:DnaJ homolog subfamily C member 17
MSSSRKNQPSFDPYDVLEVAFGASDAEITKAYRKLALQLHPDKQKSSLSEKEAEVTAKRFHDIKEARSFLLDAEHAEDRRVFDAKRESDRIRRESDAIRDKQMSESRKRMRDELSEKEAKAQSHRRRQQRKEKDEKDLVDKLRQEGQQRREEQANRTVEMEMEQDLRKDRIQRQTILEERQIRLKWDRKKVKISPSEDSIASLLSPFGDVERVEFLGKKGNQALVTFHDASSCRPCVDAFANSKEMRAKFVSSSHKEREDASDKDENEPEPASFRGKESRGRDAETLEDWRVRQAAERERLVREMQDEGDGEGVKVNLSKDVTMEVQPLGTTRDAPFPLPFPVSDKLQGLSPFEKLRAMEEHILGTLLTAHQLQSLRDTST